MEYRNKQGTMAMLANVKMYRAHPTNKKTRGKSQKQINFEELEKDSILDGLNEGYIPQAQGTN